MISDGANGSHPMKTERCKLCGREVLFARSANDLPIFLNPRPLGGYDITDTDPPRAIMTEMFIDHTATCRGVTER